MAHFDYHCCAVCDNKQEYAGSDSRTKEDICPECGLTLFELSGTRITNVGELLTWIREGELASVLVAGWSTCYYENAVDTALQARLDAAGLAGVLD